MQKQDNQDEDQEDKRSGQPVINYVEEEEDSGPALLSEQAQQIEEPVQETRQAPPVPASGQDE